MAQLIEDLAGHAPATPTPTGSLRATTATASLAYARTCYDHLAGRLGVLMYDALLGRAPARPVRRVGADARRVGLGGRVGRTRAVLRAARRPVVRDCLDWTERRPHLAGALGAALCHRFTDLGWITPGTGRAVRLTPTGRPGLAAALSIPEHTLDPPAAPPPTSGRA